jgi:membrane-bound serine protease (ClpP class)
LFLRGGAHQADGYIAAAPRHDLVGQDGVALTDLRPAGTAQIGPERVDVVTEGEYVAQGRAVRVVRSEGYRHVVRGLQ